jgi:hypothetical protein
VDWEAFLEKHSGVPSLGLAVMLSLLPVVIAGFIHLIQRRTELRFKRFEIATGSTPVGERTPEHLS